MKQIKIENYASLLYHSEKTRIEISPLTDMDADLTVDDAYQIQLHNIDRAVKEGHIVSGKKIGLTSPGIQEQLGVNEPDYGHLFKSMDCKNGEINTDHFIQPKIEAEIAFILRQDLLGGKITPADVVRATDYVVGAFEIVDSRIADWKIKLIDTISDNASSGCYVLGRKRISASDIDLSKETMKLYKNGDLIKEGSGDAVLGNPCNAVAWLANRLNDYGVTLKKGEVILSGAFSAAPEAAKGDLFEVEFSALGRVSAKFV